ncbi:MAG: hypothetical protein ACNA8P_11815 [Phycisphaerales bacterium]
MTKSEIERGFQTDFDNPGSLKSGEYLYEHILRRASRFVAEDRENLVLVLRDWVRERCEPHTMLAVSIADELRLAELRNDLVELKSDIERGKAFYPFYQDRVTKAIRQIDSPRK